VSEEGPFYLDYLLFCHVPMLGATRAGRRTYVCSRCKRRIDALAAEVEVWELATTERPDLGNGQTPYTERGQLLAGVLRRVRWLPDQGRYLLRWGEGGTPSGAA
jgi:hypothetical protein